MRAFFSVFLIFKIILFLPQYSYADGGSFSDSSTNGYETKLLPDNITELIENSNFDSAIRDLKIFIGSESRNPDAWNLLAFSQRKIGLYDESLTSYKKALKLDKKHLGAHEYIGELYLTTNQPKKSQETFEKVAKILRRLRAIQYISSRH